MERQMLWVGLTGGIGSGKSTVAAILESLGISVISADRLAHDAIAVGTEGARRVRETFGNSVFSADGSIDRLKLGELVFNDKSGGFRMALESIIHPEVRLKSESERLRLDQRGDSVAVYEIPLLFEKNLVEHFDLVITVAVSPQIQVERLIKRSGLTQEQAHARIAAQIHQDKKIYGSDFVIWNDGDERELRKQTEKILGQILKN
jgi:dephospho-CoA kinase